MRNSRVLSRAGLAALAVLLVASAAVPAQFHEPTYITGGYNNVSTINTRGVFMVNGATASMTTLFMPRHYAFGFCMDADNEGIVFTVGKQFSSSSIYSGPHAGLFRYDPTTLGFTTIHHDTLTFHRSYKVHVNQDGDYVFGSLVREWTGSRTEYHYRLLKSSPSGALSTVFTTTGMGRTALLYGAVQTDIDTGHYLVCDMYSRTTPTTIRYPVLRVSDDGVLETWSTGGDYGWYGYYAAPQDFRTGELTGPYGSRLYRLSPGTDNRTTIGFLSLVSRSSIVQSRYDVQSAASPRWIAMGYKYQPPYATYIYQIDANTQVVSSITVDATHRSVFYDFEFYRGRHVQTVRTAPRVWDLRLSMPARAGKRYAVALTASGIRPGILLPDGRTLFLNPDTFTILSVHGLLPGVFSAGPGTLDASGRAVGKLDLSLLPKLGIPIWIAVAVLDPAAPSGIAFIPDVRVMRI